MPKPLRSQIWNILGSVGVVVVALCLFIGDFVLNRGAAKRGHEEVVSEFQMIRPLPNAVVKSGSDNYRPPWRNHQGTVAASYWTAADDSSIRQHYDRELLSKGWRLVVDRPLTSWGKDSGERQIFYCKQSLYASLYLRGSSFETRYPDGDKYAFSVSWGNSPGELDGKCD